MLTKNHLHTHTVTDTDAGWLPRYAHRDGGQGKSETALFSVNALTTGVNTLFCRTLTSVYDENKRCVSYFGYSQS